jgi:hypothetical protein
VFTSASLEIASRGIPFTANADGLGWIVEAISRSMLKIALFTLALTVLVSSIAYLPISDSTRGILSGLPIVPFGGLVAVAGDIEMSVDERLQSFRGMISSVWLGPAIAVWFIYCFSRFLSARKMLSVHTADALLRSSALLLGWVLTFLIIVAIAYGINRMNVPNREARNMSGLCLVAGGEPGMMTTKV